MRERLQDPQLQVFVQRIGTDFSLEPFSRDDTHAYILHRVQAVGGSAGLFSDAACNLVYRCFPVFSSHAIKVSAEDHVA